MGTEVAVGSGVAVETGVLVLPAVVLGGLNSVPGAIVGGIAIGILQNFSGTYLDAYFPGGVKEIVPPALGRERIDRIITEEMRHITLLTDLKRSL